MLGTLRLVPTTTAYVTSRRTFIIIVHCHAGMCYGVTVSSNDHSLRHLAAKGYFKPPRSPDIDNLKRCAVDPVGFPRVFHWGNAVAPRYGHKNKVPGSGATHIARQISCKILRTLLDSSRLCVT